MIPKFRVWLEDYQVMSNVKTISFADKDIEFENEKIDKWNAWADFDDIELMQFTGLKDKNGNEIYEGDIVKNGNSNIPYKVVYQFGIFNIERCAGTYIERVSLNTWCNPFINELQVVGNIYENPELLEE